MRVALLSPFFESVPPRLYGGTERVVFNLCRGLAAAKIEVVLFASGDSAIHGREVRVVPIVEEALRLSHKPIEDPVAYNFRMLSLVSQRANEFDIIHNHHDYWMLPLTEMIRTPLVSTLHGRTDFPILSNVFEGFPNGNFVSISEAQKNFIPQLPWVKTIHHGINMNEFKFHEKSGDYLAFLGRVSCETRPELAIRIAQKAGVPLKIAAKIEGQVGKAYYDTHVKKHVDGKFIEYIGEISESEKSNFLGNAMALVFPIDWPEPFGLVVIESLACGTPVLARPFGSVPELLQDGVTGFIDADIGVLAKRVQDIEKIDRKSCREWAEKKFSLQRMTEDYIDVYRQVIEKKRNCNRWDFIHSIERPTHGNPEG